ncbi:hypothetical protein WR25_00619 isoform D [Diploscapter pachys]|uniref:C2H2-type domain-containing protein n=1 Tax=Diploscapter pachys TaxID=2018661 RepID=A0A2A2LGF7_9BILA|nr:hypothetical protein WR25_00619 isoform D [Diploscapter pachys]
MYIIIEPQSDEEASEIVTVLLQNSKKNFTITDDIRAFANRRVSGPSNSTEYHPDSDKALSPKMNSEPEPPNDIHTAIQQAIDHQFKTECQSAGDEAQNDPFASTSTDYLNSSAFIQDLLGRHIDPNFEEPQLKRRRGSVKYLPVECKVCGAHVQAKGNDWHTKSAHAIVHSNILRYMCPICGYKNRHRSEIARHITKQHEMSSKNIKIPDAM